MTNTRVKEIMVMLENETDPDKIKILEFDLAEARGQKDKGVKRRAKGGSEMTDKQKKFASLAEPFDEITYADRIAGATKGNKVRKAAGGGNRGGNFGGDEVLAAGASRGGGAAIRGMKFVGIK